MPPPSLVTKAATRKGQWQNPYTIYSCTGVRRRAFVTVALGIHFPAARSWEASHVSLANTSPCRESANRMRASLVFIKDGGHSVPRVRYLSSFIPCHSVQYHTMGCCCSGHNRMPYQFSLPPRPRQSGCPLTRALHTTGTSVVVPPFAAVPQSTSTPAHPFGTRAAHPLRLPSASKVAAGPARNQDGPHSQHSGW